MRRLPSAWLLVLLLLSAGCLEADPGLAVAAQPAAPPSPAPQPPADPPGRPRHDPAPPPFRPLVVDVSAQLRQSAAELTVPAGSFGLVRLVYDEAVWNESRPWDGEAIAWTAFAYHMAGDGVFMQALAMRPADYEEDQALREPVIDFFPAHGDGWWYGYLWSTCTGCEGVPRHERAWLIGGAGDTTLRVGLVEEGQDAEVLWTRPAVQVRADAQTRDAFAGVAGRLTYQGSEGRFQFGVMSAEWGDPLAPGASLQRWSHYHGEAAVLEPGILVAKSHMRELAGAEDWSYSLEAPGLDRGGSGRWTHDPLYVGGEAPPGVVSDSRILAQGNAAPGPVRFGVERTFTGAGDPTTTVAYEYEAASLGHAGVDLDALFGWPTGEPAPPEAGRASAWDCGATSLSPVPSCVALG